ncbi:MAG: prolyl-tRNA synthetase associated domain-containing protein [Lachnospiraceae bacterium]|nr:prolyl-tRNA synthetase associated domain-containing protein [Lachnospiraceae bacterium]
MELEFGRPEDLSGREQREIKVYDFLDSLGIGYERIDHEPLMTMELCVKAEDILTAPVCKNLLLCNRQKTAFYLLLMPGDKKFKTKELSSQINSARLSFAEGEDMERLLDIHPGSLSVMGLINDDKNEVSLLIDEDLYANEFIGCHPCMNTSTLKIKSADLFDKFLPAVHHTPVKVKLIGED